MSFECETCVRRFHSYVAVCQHMDALDHWGPIYECETCSREFGSQHAANQHMNAVGHWAPKIECDTCTAKFHTQDAADEHMDALGHWKHYCEQCERKFQNANNLRAHLNSKIHRGTQVHCPFCSAAFVTASGLSHHLETGSCRIAPTLNRNRIAQLIRQFDPHHYITTKQIEYHSSSATSTTYEYEVTNAAYNGAAWECYICHREFRSSAALRQHVNSPTHQQRIYRCPNGTARCGREFVSLAALFNHLESESCGFMRFEKVVKVQRSLTDAMTGNGRRLIQSEAFFN
ncbi:Zinc finger C2H2 type domain-containing protein [Penicillium ucsense]|uniref:Zinc finger C2H2 type domain-containing protein n=1 Tax=Penicillium ucsense TaxID=2839758 RepID=A0A8J8WK18_9EURO|nr:Zinc finger C2H2 type domain-containing protein [Penicillium ucsense]KAF7736524.1 Zinc finger C2H2 type domain-containing protein [Penicillium ucsense]